ncbi:DUF6089 family protein [Nafulsella turpanensis]|uniref:DUF6089 family protein n=1 Tax=Nafulsella turpanensis TaxID=1265690 RepID=UPI000349947D|nr:DUF6089 family protein [Nafulsella turpanensis]
MQYKRSTLLACLLLLCTTLAWGQELEITETPAYKPKNRHGDISYSAGVGLSTYYGDLKANSIDIWGKPSIQLGALYRFNNHLHFRTELIWYRISGADSLNDEDTRIYGRNLSFRSDNIELNAVALYELYNRYSQNRPLLIPYGFIGLGLTTVSPEAFYEGKWYDLRPLMTEGEAYSPLTLVIPFGVGVSYVLDDQWDISFEYGYRYAFTDYLDDASGSYVGVENIEDPIRRALSDRRPEKGLAPAPAGFEDRGNGKSNDWYLITGLKVRYTPPLSNKNPSFR